MTLIIPFVD